MQAQLTPLPTSFLDQWAGWYPDAQPVGFLLRDAYPDRWLRIHSLPDSKRYATSGWEYAELVRRHNAVATDLLGQDAPCAVVTFAECGGNERRGIESRLGLTGGELSHIGSLPEAFWDEREGVFAEPTCLYGAATTWRPGEFNGLIEAVAEDRAVALIVALGGGQVYAPYDGGADLFYPSEFERELARDRFRAWLSSHPEGL